MDTGIAATSAVSRGASPVPFSSARWTLALPRDRRLELDRAPRVMGVVNVTPDSFSDGGRYLDADHALARAEALLAAGADLVDLGAESTRPGGGVYGEGAREVAAAEEIERLRPILGALRQRTTRPISIDTRKAEVARWALDSGADLVNDVSALSDPEMGAVVAEAGCPVILMHSRGSLRTMQQQPSFDDVVEDVRRELESSLAKATAAGVASSATLLDPGIGFGKSYSQNLELLRHLDRLVELGRPVVVGASRKAFLGHLTGEPPERRQAGSLAAAAWAALHGASIVRVHDVAETAQFLRVWTAVRDADGSEG